MSKMHVRRISVYILALFFANGLRAQVIALDDITVVDEDASVFIPVQENDINLGSGALYTILISTPPNGSVEIFDQDSILYTPDLNYSGIDTFTYEVYNEDEIPSYGTAQVVITVIQQPDFPIANTDFDTTSVEVPIIIDVQANDINFDPEFLVTQIVAAPLHGTAAVIGGISIEYTPEDDYFGNDAFTYSVCNPVATAFCDTANIFIHVSETNFFHPFLLNDSAEVLTGNDATVDVLANDSDGDGDALYVSDIFYTTLAGSVSLNADYTITYSAVSAGTDTIYYIGCDINSPSYCDTALLMIRVPENTGSLINVPDSFSPNGDGKNDYFEITGLANFPAFNLQIFNRWGDLVFENTDIHVAWDGNANVSALNTTGRLPEGTYFYILQAETAEVLQGYIEMRR